MFRRAAQDAALPVLKSTTEAESIEAVREILKLLPADVRADLDDGAIDVTDPAFLDGLTDHVSRLALADPQAGRRLLGEIIRLKKRLSREMRAQNPDYGQPLSRNSATSVGRNAACPCGSGKKYKVCCLRKSSRA